MPGRVSVKVLAARNLPVMDRASEACDAFTEVRLGQVCYKTEIYRKSLHPQWNSEWFRFEVDDEALQDERLQLRVMDYDTYSANDAIGKVYIDLNYLLRESNCAMQGWLPIYDTLHGIRGEINVTVKVDLISDANKYRVSSVGMRFFYSDRVPDGFRLVSVLGFTEELIAGDDPEFHWMDRIRTPRASNETRQALFARFSGQLQRHVGLKALELGGNAVLGYQQYFDIEGDTGIVVRGIGTAVKLEAEASGVSVPCKQGPRTTMSEDMAEYPFITMKVVPQGLIESVGGVVSARSVKLLDESEAETRDSWWTELRKEIRSHAKSLGCNIVIGYSETTTIYEEVLLLSASGTAALLSSPGHAGSTECTLCHAPYRASSVPFKTQLSNCEVCSVGKVPDVLFMTIEPPASLGNIERPCLIQARVCKSKKDLKGEASAREISDNLPFLEYELHKQMLANMKKHGMNAILGLNVQVAIGEHFVSGVAIGTACVISALPQPGSTAPPAVSGSLSESEDDDILSSSFKQRLCIMNLDHSDTPLHEGRDSCIIRQPPDGFFLASTETPLIEELPSCCSQLIMQAFRVRLQQGYQPALVGACTPPPQLPLGYETSRHLDRIIQSLFVRLRKYRPCQIFGLQIKTMFPQADEMQVTVLGTVLHGDNSGSRHVGVDVSTLSTLPGREVESYLGNLNFFLIRETTNLTQSLNAFVATFLDEILAIARCHVSALGGNGLLSFKTDHQLLLHGTHKHQGQCLVSVQGDAVLLKSVKSQTSNNATRGYEGPSLPV